MSTVKRHQIEMMMDRGFIIPPHDLELLTLSDMDVWKKTKGYTNLDEVYTMPGEREIKSGVFYRQKGNSYVQVDAILNVIQAIQEGLQEAVIIVNANLSPTAKLSLNRMVSCKVQMWLESDLYVNPTKHIFTPKHVLLKGNRENEIYRAIIRIEGDVPTAEEKQLARSKMSKMHHKDIMSKWYAFPVGAVVELHCDYSILRGAERTSLKYRVVV